MKLKNLFIAALAVTGLFSACSKDDMSDQVGNETGEKAKITIKLSTPTKLKATGLSTDDSDNAINNFIAFVFKSNGAMEEKIVSSNGLPVQSTSVTTAAREVYVVSNTPASLFTSVTDKTSLLAVLGDLAASATTSTQSSAGAGNVWASGFSTLDASSFVENPTTHIYETSVNVLLTFVPAKINVTIDNQMINQTAPGALAITKVAVLNAITQTKFFGSSLIPSPTNYYAGMDETGFHIVPSGYVVRSFLTNNYSTSDAGYHYYVFENNSDTYPVILTLVATFGSETRYFPVHFTMADAGYQVQRGNSYEIRIRLTGNADPNGGDDPGTDDPTDPFVRANMTVSVSVKSWITHPVIEKEF